MSRILKKRSTRTMFVFVVLSILLMINVGVGQAETKAKPSPTPKFLTPVAFDVSPSLKTLAATAGRKSIPAKPDDEGVLEIRPERGPVAIDKGHSGDGAIQTSGARMAPGAPTVPDPSLTFEGLSNQDNFNVFGFRVNPPDPVGDVGPNHYVEMINLIFGVYSKDGTLLLGPVDTGTLWAGFPIEDCTDPSGDPIVVYDQFVDRWLLTQFTTRGLADPTLPFYNCVAISQTGDPTGAYYRYAFITQADPDGGYYFPDYPKYGVWRDTYVLTTRDFGSVDGYGISVYGLEKNKMVDGNPNRAQCSSFLTLKLVFRSN